MKETNNSEKSINSNSRKSRVIFLDGIRGWASFGVLLSHIIVCFLSLSTPSLNFNKERIAFDFLNNNYFSFLFGIFFRFITDGHLAVVVFFVLSGYALSVNNLCFKTRNLALAAISRYFRLMIPIFITSAIAYLLLRYGLFFNLEAAVAPIGASSWLGGFYNFDASVKGFVVFSLYDVFFKYNPELTYNSVLWTMSVEMFGSLFVYAYLGVFRAKETVHWKLIFIILVTSFFYKTLYACFAAGYLIAEFNNKNAENGALFSSKLAQRGLIALAVVASVVSTFYPCRSTQLIWHRRSPAYTPFPRRSLANAACPARGF